ncbi:hypothetical protein TSMEX_000170, partial [Taenia solium]|eukprot:TsM_000281200 transcript=TsM_000281200 gene=TsM_000281200
MAGGSCCEGECCDRATCKCCEGCKNRTGCSCEPGNCACVLCPCTSCKQCCS